MESKNKNKIKFDSSLELPRRSKRQHMPKKMEDYVELDSLSDIENGEVITVASVTTPSHKRQHSQNQDGSSIKRPHLGYPRPTKINGVIYSKTLGLLDSCDCKKPTIKELVADIGEGQMETLNKMTVFGDLPIPTLLHMLAIF